MIEEEENIPRGYEVALQRARDQKDNAFLKADVELRKWCVEHATIAITHEEIYQFLTIGSPKGV